MYIDYRYFYTLQIFIAGFGCPSLSYGHLPLCSIFARILFTSGNVLVFRGAMAAMASTAQTSWTNQTVDMLKNAHVDCKPILKKLIPGTLKTGLRFLSQQKKATEGRVAATNGFFGHMIATCMGVMGFDFIWGAGSNPGRSEAFATRRLVLHSSCEFR